MKLRRLAVWSIAVGTIWLYSPPHVLAVGDSVEDMFKKQQQGQTPTVGVATGDDSILWSMIQLIFALGIIIAVIYLFIRFLSQRTNLSRGNVFQSLGTHAMTANRSVHMLAVGNKIYVLGIGDNVQLIDTITDSVEIERLKQDSEVQSQANLVGSVSGFQELINRLRKRNSQAQVEEIEIEELSFDVTLREKLDSLKKQRQETVHDLQDGQER